MTNRQRYNKAGMSKFNPFTPLLSYGYSYKASRARLVKPSFVIFDIRAL